MILVDHPMQKTAREKSIMVLMTPCQVHTRISHSGRMFRQMRNEDQEEAKRVKVEGRPLQDIRG